MIGRKAQNSHNLFYDFVTKKKKKSSTSCNVFYFENKKVVTMAYSAIPVHKLMWVTETFLIEIGVSIPHSWNENRHNIFC